VTDEPPEEPDQPDTKPRERRAGDPPDGVVWHDPTVPESGDGRADEPGKQPGEPGTGPAERAPWEPPEGVVWRDPMIPEWKTVEEELRDRRS
jgi:hypothetical protein